MNNVDFLKPFSNRSKETAVNSVPSPEEASKCMFDYVKEFKITLTEFYPKVDVFDLCLLLGVQIREQPMKKNFAGGILKERGESESIVYDDAFNNNLLRFFVAFCLGHFLQCSVFAGFDEYAVLHEFTPSLLQPVKIVPNLGDSFNDYSFEFAANLLVPLNVLRGVLEVDEEITLDGLGKIFAVPKFLVAYQVGRV